MPDTRLPRPNEFQFCCGTSCNAQENLAYVKQLEAELIDLQDRNNHLVKSVCHANDKISELTDTVQRMTADKVSRDYMPDHLG